MHEKLFGKHRYPKDKTIEVKMAQTDSNAALVYSKGVSIIHLGMLIAWFYVVQPDRDYAATFPVRDDAADHENCARFAREVTETLQFQLINHIICLVVCYFTEIHETAMGAVGWTFKTLEIIATMLNFLVSLFSVCILFRFYAFQKRQYLECYAEANVEKFLGSAIPWLLIEVLVFYIFLFTLILNLIKSQCGVRVFMNNTRQFEPRFMAFLCNHICEALMYKVKHEILTVQNEPDRKRFPDGIYSEAKIVGKKLCVAPFEKVRLKIPQSEVVYRRDEHTSVVEKSASASRFLPHLRIFIRLDAEDYYNIIRVINEPDFEIEGRRFVRESEALDWMHRCVVGKITKERLDAQRQAEVNANDMMQNTSIIYHCESISGTQLLVLLIIWLYAGWEVPEHLKHFEEKLVPVMDMQQVIMVLLCIEHATCYFIEMFRRWEVDKSGIHDVNGIPRAPIESWLSLVQYFYIFFLIGFISQKMLTVDRAIMPFRVQLATLWILVDTLVMFMSRIFIAFALRVKQTGELVKNMYTLYMVQQEHFRYERLRNYIRE